MKYIGKALLALSIALLCASSASAGFIYYGTSETGAQAFIPGPSNLILNVTGPNGAGTAVNACVGIGANPTGTGTSGAAVGGGGCSSPVSYVWGSVKTLDELGITGIDYEDLRVYFTFDEKEALGGNGDNVNVASFQLVFYPENFVSGQAVYHTGGVGLLQGNEFVHIVGLDPAGAASLLASKPTLLQNPNTKIGMFVQLTNKSHATLFQAYVGARYDEETVDQTDHTPVPEPTTLLLSGAGLALLGIVRRKFAQ